MKFLNGFLNIFRIKKDYSNRVFGLDLMRALAIIFVVMGHGSMLDKADTNFPYIKLIDGVELFFVLSGFLIGGILLRTLINEKTLNFTTLKNFWIRRWFKILPNYYLVLLLNIILVYYGFIYKDNGWENFNWKFFFFLQNLYSPFYAFFWESWCLSVAVWFYIFFPIFLVMFYYVLNKMEVSKKDIFLITVVTFLTIPFILRHEVAADIDVDSFWLGVKIYKVVIFRLDAIALGLLAAYIKYYYPNAWFKSRNITFILGIVISYLILYSVWEPNHFVTKVYRISFQSIGCALLLAKFDSIKTAPKGITKVVTHISLISYSMYLINLGLVSEVIRDNFPPTNAKEAVVTYLIFWAVVLIGSTLLYKYYERPITNLRERFSKK